MHTRVRAQERGEAAFSERCRHLATRDGDVDCGHSTLTQGGCGSCGVAVVDVAVAAVLSGSVEHGRGLVEHGLGRRRHGERDAEALLQRTRDGDRDGDRRAQRVQRQSGHGLGCASCRVVGG